MRPLRAAAIAVCIFAASCVPSKAPEFPDAAPEAKPGGKLVIGIESPRSIDPGSTDPFDAAGALVHRAICDPLITFDPVTGAPRPAILETWRVDNRGATITLRLKRGVRFHDGTEVTAADVIFSLSRVARFEYGSPVAALLEPVAGYELLRLDVSQLPPDHDDRSREKLSGLTYLDRYSLQMNLTKPLADFYKVLGHPLASPVPEAAVKRDPDAFARKPVCTGPYKLANGYQQGARRIVVERFADYYKANQGTTIGGAGYSDTIEFRIASGRSQQLSWFRRGAIDVAHIASTDLKQASSVAGGRIVTGSAPLLSYVGVPVPTAPFDSPTVRIALSKAIDRGRIAEEIFDGTREPATTFLPPALGAVHERDSCALNAPVAADVAGARADLRRAGIDLQGTTFSLSYNDEFHHRALIESIAESWREAFGVRVETRPSDWEAYLSEGRRGNGFDGAFLMTWGTPYPSADRFLAPMFTAASVGVDNFSRYRNTRFDRELADTARRSVVEDDAARAYRSLEDILCEDMPVIPVAFGSRSYLVSDRIGSARSTFTDRSSGEVLLRELYVKG